MDKKSSTKEEPISINSLLKHINIGFVFLLGKWKSIFIAGLIGSMVGLSYGFIFKPIYTSECSFVLEENDGGSGLLGSLGGLAGMIGIDIGGGGGLFQGENILYLYRSRSMLTQTLLTKIPNTNTLLIDRYIVANNLREKWNKKAQLTGINFNISPDKYTLNHDSIIGEIVKEINKKSLTVSKPDKKLSIIYVLVESTDEVFAKEFTDILVKNVNDFYVETKTKKAYTNLLILKHQADSVKRELNNAIYGVALANQSTPSINPLLQTLRVPSQRRQVDAQANQLIYGEIVKNLELAKISIRRETPLIQIIDNPIYPLKNNKLSKSILMILGFIILTVFFSVYLIIRNKKD